MSGTAVTEAEEFWKIYKLDVLPIPTNLEYMASRNDSEYVTFDSKDEQGYRFTYYARRKDSTKQPVFWRRKDFPDVVFRTEEAKLRAITLEIIQYHVLGRPQLVGTTSVEHSERLSDRLGADPIRRLLLAQLLRGLYLEAKEIQIIERAIPELQPLYVPLDKLDMGDMRQLARNLGINMSFNAEDPANLDRILSLLHLPEERRNRLVKVLQAGVPHQVLNARKHDEESKIIAKAGAFGAVTIATNMAGRGVDIKLGGELDEEVLGDVNRILERAGYDAYNMTNDQRRAALQKLSAEDYGIYEEAVNAFFQYIEEMEQVRALGGLHVIGSERHEARRIDNQLRGRAARQGDPGSSRFYLALDDELMRLFGGKQVEGLLSRLNIDESLPIESGMVGRLVEQSQTRVEGANFDVRKHLLEYDDVLNAQRKRIYDQRDRVFTKEDLSEDLAEMLRTELQQRVPQALKDEEGPWKLVAYIDEIQPPILYEDLRYPSYSMRLLIDHLLENRPAQGATVSRLREDLLNLARRALEAEHDHLIHSFRQMFERSEATLETQRMERFDALDAFIDSLPDREEETGPLRIQEVSEELAGITRLPNFRLSNEQFRLVREDPRELSDQLKEQIGTFLQSVAISRLVGFMERRLGESLNVRLNQYQGLDWLQVTDQLLQEVENVLQRQYDRLLGDRQEGQIARALEGALSKLDEYTTDEGQLLEMLGLMMEGVRMVFDRKTHRQGFQRTTRLNYAFLAGQLLQDRPVQVITDKVLDQLEGAQELLGQAWGRYDWGRRVQNEHALEDELGENEQSRLRNLVGSDHYEEIKALPLRDLEAEDAEAVKAVLGWAAQNEMTRQLLLSTISDLWVDYLTRVEALRVSIGLEAYAQRDPLVQYKGRASEMFQQLLADIRMGVISRLFGFRPRSQPAETRLDGGGLPAPVIAAVPAGVAASPQPAGAPGGKNKKKRKRH